MYPEREEQGETRALQTSNTCFHTNRFPKQVIKQPICTHSEDELVKIYQEKNQSHQTKLISSFDNTQGG